MGNIRPVTWLPLVLAGVLAVSAGACGKEDPQKYVTSGDQYVEQGKLREAVVEYRHAIQLDPKLGEISVSGDYVKQGQVVATARAQPQFWDLTPPNDNLNVNINWDNILGRDGLSAKL